MPDESHVPDTSAPSSLSDSSLQAGDLERADAMPVRVLVSVEHVLLYVVSLVLLLVGAGVLVVAITTALQSHVSWTERLIGIIEGLLLILIIMEIFVTVLNHLRGGRLQFEFFIVIGIIAVVRHILSIVVRLTVPSTVAADHRPLTDLAVDAGATFVLVAALALARWSGRRSDTT